MPSTAYTYLFWLQSSIVLLPAKAIERSLELLESVGRPAIAKLRLSLEYWGVPYPPRCVRLRQPCTLRQAHREGLQAYLKGNPGAYMDEMRDSLYDEYDVRITVSTVYRELERMRWFRKIASKRAKEQSEPLRQLYLVRMAQNYTAEQIVALDKSACNERTGDSKYSRAPVG
jgi:hypothetical protein